MEPLDKIHARLVETSTGCLEWTGKRTAKGYGLFKISGKWVRIHRLVLEAKAGPLGDLCALHTCDNPPCCNAEHLYAGTAANNNRDTLRRGRRSRGGVPNAKVRREDVPVIRARWRAGESQAVIGCDFGITGSQVSRIVRGRAWGGVPGAVGGKEAGVLTGPRHAKLRPADIAAMRELHSSGSTFAALGRRFGVHASTVVRGLSSVGVGE